MFDIIAPLYTEWNTTERITTEKTKDYACTPLISSTFILKFCTLLFIVFAIRALESHLPSLAIESGQTHEFTLLLSYQKLRKLASC
jgi:hypothetical protein